MPEAQNANFKGVPIHMNGRTYIVPGLSARQFKQNIELLSQPLDPNMTTIALMEQRLPIIEMAIQRNYPEVTTENLLDWVDQALFTELLVAVQTGSGMRTAKSGEATPV